MRRVLIGVLFGVLLLLLLGGCNPTTKPDLVVEPLPDLSGPISFCRVNAAGELVVLVKNQGDGDAAASTVSVEFTPGGAVTASVPAITAGNSAESDPLVAPAECYNPDCEFAITLDSTGALDESNEDNNTADGSCLG